MPFPSPMHKVKSESEVAQSLFVIPWTAAYQAPPSMGFSRQEYWSGVPSPSPMFISRHHQMTLFSLVLRPKHFLWLPLLGNFETGSVSKQLFTSLMIQHLSVIKSATTGISLAVQWLRLNAFNGGGREYRGVGGWEGHGFDPHSGN